MLQKQKRKLKRKPPACVLEGEETARSNTQVLHASNRIPHVHTRFEFSKPLEEISRIHAMPGLVLDVKDTKPTAALKVLADRLQACPAKKAKWRDEARVAAIVGSCPRSKDSHCSGSSVSTYATVLTACLDSGIKHWVIYIGIAYSGAEEQAKHAFPPNLQDVLGWSNTFQCLGTFWKLPGLLKRCVFRFRVRGT